MKILHFNKERYLGIVEMEDKLYVVQPPFNSMSLINKEFSFDRNVREYKKVADIYKKLKMEFHVTSLTKMQEIISKSKTNSVLNLTSENIRDTKVKSLLRELSQGRIYQLDLNDIQTINIAIGVSPFNKREIADLISLIDVDAEKAFSKSVRLDGGLWKEDIDGLIDFVEKTLIPEGRFDEADKTLSFLLMEPSANVSSSLNERMNELLTVTKSHLMKDAIDRGDNFAKPWQKYTSPGPVFFKRAAKKTKNTKSTKHKKA